MRVLPILFLVAACSDKPAAAPVEPQVQVHRYQAVSRCAIALQNLAKSGGGMGTVAEGCQDIYSDATCRQAFVDLAHAADHDAALPRVAAACAHAYCGKLAGGDAVCEKDFATLSTTELQACWAHLNGRIFAHEMGVPPDDPAAKAYEHLFGTTVVRVGPAPAADSFRPDAPSVTVTVTTGDAGVSFGGEGLPAITLATPTAEALAPLARAAAAASGEGGEVVIAADGRVSHGAVVALMDALRTAGVKRLALAVDLRSASAPTPGGR